MPIKTFTAAVLTASDVNTYLMKQAVITCTSGTRPASPVAGMVIYETDTSLLSVYDGAAWGYLGGWTTFTPSWTATTTNPSINNGTLTGGYSKVGKTVNFWIKATMGSTTTFGAGSYRFSVPVTMLTNFPARFKSVFTDASASLFYEGGTGYVDANTLAVTVFAGGAGGSLTIAGPAAPFTWATSDTLEIIGSYQAA